MNTPDTSSKTPENEHVETTCSPDTEWENVAGEEIQKNSAVYRADDGKIYKSLTYPNTFSEVVEYLLERKDVLAMATKEDAKDVLTYQIGKALSSRDTYWKEKVRKEVELNRVTEFKDCGKCNYCELAMECEERIADRAWNQALDTLLDNLK